MEGAVFYIISQTKNRLRGVKDPHEMTVVTYVDDTLTSKVQTRTVACRPTQVYKTA